MQRHPTRRPFRILRPVGLVVLICFSAGCSRLDFSRGAVHNPLTDVLDSGEAYVAGAGPEDVEARKMRLEAALQQWTAQEGPRHRDYILGSGDVLKVSIFALEAPDRTSDFERTVGKEGDISLPWVGSIKAGGLSAPALEEAVKEVYEGQYLKNPQVTVNIEKYQSVPIIMTGAVAKPGVYYLTENSSTVLEMLAQAGGLSDAAAGEILVVRENRPVKPGVLSLRDGLGLSTPAAPEQVAGPKESIRIDLKQLIDTGDFRLNIDVGAGDIVSVTSSKRQYVYVLGYVARPGAFELRGGQQIDALRAVAMAGGLSALGRAENASILREEKGRQKMTDVDLIKMATGVRPLVYMQPGDTLIVGTSFFARASEIVRPTVGAGVNYAPAVP